MADTNRPRSAEETTLLERARRRLPGGVLGTSRYADEAAFVVKRGQGSKIYAMTSEGSTRVVPSYGVVSSAKAALESHVRQLAMELARQGSGATANCIRAGVTVTPALLKIPESQTMIDITMKRNPTGRMTTPQDVANAILALSGDGTDFINGDIISVDGGEFVTGS